MNISFSHIPFEQLVDLIEHRLPAQKRELVQAHLAICAECADNLASLEFAVELMRTDTSREFPQDVIARTVSLFQAQPSPAPTHERRHFLAQLHLDSALLPFGFALRSGTTAERQLLFHAGPFELDVRITPLGLLWLIWGQILGTDETGQIELRAPTGTTFTALNSLGEFQLPPTPAGTYILVLQLTSAEIEVSALTLG